MFLQPDANPCSNFTVDNQFNPRNLFGFLAEVVQQCLYNTRETAGWIKTSRIDCAYYLPVLMMRLMVILCSLCLNSYVPFSVLVKALNAPQITSQLPRGFCEALSRTNKNATAIAAAFKVIGDPLMVVSLTGARPKFVSPDAVFVDLRSFSCRYAVMKVLFPPVERNVTGSSNTGICPAVSNIQTESAGKSDSNLSSENVKWNLQIKWGLIREMSEALESLKNRNDRKMRSIVLKKKEEIEEHVSVLTCALAQLSELVRSHSEEKKELFEATSVIEELKMICSLLGVSDADLKAESTVIGGLLKSLETRRPQLDALFSQLTVQNDPDISSVDDKKLSDSNPVAEDKKSEDSAAAAAADVLGIQNLQHDVGGKNHSKLQGAECSQAQGKGKNKKNKKKSRKGKGGQGR